MILTGWPFVCGCIGISIGAGVGVGVAAGAMFVAG